MSSQKQTDSACQAAGDITELKELPETSDAPWPPLKLVERAPILPFPVEVFPPSLQEFCRGVADAKSAPLDFVGASMLAVAGAAIGQSVNIEIKSDWTEPPLLYMILVAPPGKTKSPVIRAVVQPLTEADDRLRKESESARRRWEEGKRSPRRQVHEPCDKLDHPSDDVAPEAQDIELEPEPLVPDREPPQLRVIVKDITRESLVILLADNPGGLLCDPDEASAWVASFNEYKGKDGSDRQFWLSTWNCSPVSVDRKGTREATHVATPFVAVLGGLQPDLLTSLSDKRGRDDGFMDRIMFVYPERFPSQRWNDVELSEQAKWDWSRAIRKLFETPLSAVSGFSKPHLVSLTSGARARWVKWFDGHASETEGTEIPDRLQGAWSKLRSHTGRFALILSRLRSVCGSQPDTDGEDEGPDEATADVDRWHIRAVDGEDVEGAIKLSDYFKSQLLRVAHQMSGGFESSASNEVLDWIRRKGLTSFREADVGTDLRQFRSKSQLLRETLRCLAEAGAIRQLHEPHAAGKRGPKPTPLYDVRPDLFDTSVNTSNSAISPAVVSHQTSGETDTIVDEPETGNDTSDWEKW
jgi:Protein of unknown function (DUF3987)